MSERVTAERGGPGHFRKAEGRGIETDALFEVGPDRSESIGLEGPLPEPSLASHYEGCLPRGVSDG
jgi:hypothetical protein